MSEQINAKTLWKKHKPEIVLSIIGSLIASFIFQIAGSAPDIGKSFLETILNYVFSSASMMDEQALITLFFTMTFIFVIIYTLTNTIIKISSLNNKDNKIPRDTENPEKALQKLNKKIDILEKRIKKSGIMVIITTILLSIHLIITIIAPAIINAGFKNNITMIKPYTDSQTVMMLESDWIRMKSKDNYDKIYDIINQIKEENGLPRK